MNDDPQIEHLLDIIENPETGEIEQVYNYLVYQFEHPAGMIGARAYLDEIDRVAIFDLPPGWKDDPIVRRILAFLMGRYRNIERFDRDGDGFLPLRLLDSRWLALV